MASKQQENKRVCGELVNGKPCGRSVKTRGLCQKHYEQWRIANGVPQCVQIRADGKQCPRPRWGPNSQELCKGHFQLWQERNTDEQCSAPAIGGDGKCEKGVRARGLCATHLQMLRNHGRVESILTSCVAVDRNGQCDTQVRKDASTPYCAKHQERLEKYGQFDVPEKPVRVCLAPNKAGTGSCPKKHYEHDLCSAHSSQLGRHGHIELLDGTVITIQRPQCRASTENGQCEEGAVTRGLCINHYDRLRRYASLLLADGTTLNIDFVPCPADNSEGGSCGRPVVTNGLCSKDSQVLAIHGEVLLADGKTQKRMK